MTDSADTLASPAPDDRPRGPEEPLRDLEEQLRALDRKFDEKIRQDAAREQVVDRLHAELQEYRLDLVHKTLRPVLRDLVALHDDLGRALAQPEVPSGDGEGRFRRMLEDLRQDVADALARQDALPFEAEGDVFDGRRQRAARTEPAPEEALVGRVAARLRPGFAVGDKVLRPELVSVYVRPTLVPGDSTS